MYLFIIVKWVLSNISKVGVVENLFVGFNFNVLEMVGLFFDVKIIFFISFVLWKVFKLWNF